MTTMLHEMLMAIALVAITAALHVGGLVALLNARMKPGTRPPAHFWPTAWLLISVTWCVILIHLAEIAIWALFYLWLGCLPDAESALYFSAVTYATIGYGDVVLQAPWRLFAPVQGLTGILMCGLSTGLFFAMLSKIYASRLDARSLKANP
jgi:hypothetical protein